MLGGKKIIAYGAGDGFLTFDLYILKRHGFKLHAVLDRRFECGDTHCGVPAFNPLEYKPAEEELDAVVVITVGTKEYHKEIFGCLYELGFRNVILTTDIYEYHLICPPERPSNTEKILEGLSVFSDDLSCEVYRSVVQTHTLRKVVPVPSCPLEEQYFPRDIRLRYSRFVNCGAYNGDTLKRLYALHGKVDAIACFEPDKSNFEQLTQYLEDAEIAGSVRAFPYGVFSHATELPFAAGYKTNSAISDNGETVVQCVAMDQALNDFHPTFICMDIEGAELEALKGAESLIREDRPDLAVCVYHSPSHIWEIPLYLDGLHLGYKFYLRNYTGFVGETVLYAIGDYVKS